MLDVNNYILADGRWSGQHGIGRFSAEVLSRLQHTGIIATGPKPLSIKNLFWLPAYLFRARKKYKVFFSPGFCPVLASTLPFVLTVHDLIHLLGEGSTLSKKIYYEYLLKPSLKKAHKVLTVSEFSRKTILEWTNIPEDKVINVSCGISNAFTPNGKKHIAGYSYILHIGNTTKPHKNVNRLLQAFANAKAPDLHLILTQTLSAEQHELLNNYRITQRVHVQPGLSEEQLAEYYRGARAVVFPSLYEGFGLPVIEGMACGVPVLTSNVTSLPEIAGDAAWLIDPLDIDAMTAGIEKIIADETLRGQLVQAGLERTKQFSWDETALRVNRAILAK